MTSTKCYKENECLIIWDIITVVKLYFISTYFLP